jgi:hypothetical protein
MPGDGQRCSANVQFECRYGTANCVCDGNNWHCSVPVCEAPQPNGSPSSCVWPAIYTCDFPALDQICTCGDVSFGMLCTCPTVMPADNSLCPGPVGGGCSYGDRVCDCPDGRWRCGVCPVDLPTNGRPCAFPASCSYETGFCYCDGTTWSCS